MVVARSEVVFEGIEGVYHVVSRCVRRAFLCGKDAYSGNSYEHRKEWVRSRLEELADGFAIEVCAYSAMSNHVHIVLRTRPDWPEEWTDEEIARRWLSIFPKRRDVDALPKIPNPQEIKAMTGDREKMEKIRGRLSSVSWFMRCFNEYIARRANREDGCKGRFWEGRFKCQALLDEAAYMAAMVYVELNPIRAGLAETPEESEFTSASERIIARQAQKNLDSMSADTTQSLSPQQKKTMDLIKVKANTDRWLCPIDNESPQGPRGILPLNTDQYLDLIDWTGRLIREDKRGAIPDHLCPILQRLEIDTVRWLDTVQNYGSIFHRAVGRLDTMTASAQKAGKRWWQGIRACREAFSPA